MILANLLSSSGYIIVNKELIKVLGLHEAIILGELCSEYTYWENRNQLEDGEYFFSTRKNIEKNTGINSHYQRIAIRNMENKGILDIRKVGMPCKNYYKINENRIIEYLERSKEQVVHVVNNKMSTTCSTRYELDEVHDVHETEINNNKNNNKNIDRLFNYIIDNKNEFPSEFKNVDFIEIDKLLERYEMKYNSEVIKYISEENLKKIKDITYVICLIVKDKLQHLNYKVSRDKLIKIYDDCKNKELENKDTELEIANFMNYYYKSIVNELVKEKSNPSFFMPKKEEIEDVGGFDI